MSNRKIKVIIAKPGLDGHDRGAKVVARGLVEAGMEVVYTGLHQTVEQIVRTAIQEAVDVVGLSIMSGAHIPICQKLLELMKNEGLQEIPVVVGGGCRPHLCPPEFRPGGRRARPPGGKPGGEPGGAPLGDPHQQLPGGPVQGDHLQGERRVVAVVDAMPPLAYGNPYFLSWSRKVV